MTNNVGAARDRYTDTQVEYRTFDRLPAAVRRAYWSGVVEWSVRGDPTMLKQLRQSGMTPQRAAECLAAHIRRCDQHEVEQFGAALPQAFGSQSPHQRAGATLQPYGAYGPVAPKQRRRVVA